MPLTVWGENTPSHWKVADDSLVLLLPCKLMFPKDQRCLPQAFWRRPNTVGVIAALQCLKRLFKAAPDLAVNDKYVCVAPDSYIELNILTFWLNLCAHLAEQALCSSDRASRISKDALSNLSPLCSLIQCPCKRNQTALS